MLVWAGRALLACGALITGASVLATTALGHPLPIAVQVAVEVLSYGGASGAAALAAVRAGSKRYAWSALAVGVSVYGLGDVVFTLDAGRLVGGVELFDVLYAAGYVGLGAVVPLLIRTIATRMHISIWLDAATVVLGGLAAATAFLINPAYEAVSGDQSTAALLYICADVVLLASLATLTSILGLQRARAVVGSVVAVLILLVGDGYYYWGTVGGSYVVGAVLDHSYLVGMLLLAWMAHRSPREAAVVDNLQQPRLEVPYLVMPVAGAAVALLTVLWDGVHPSATALPAVLAVSCIAAGTLRVLITLTATRSFYELREQVAIDPLTGLGNRRALTGHLDRVLASGSGEVTILLVDIDQFRDINHAVGNAAGDQVLCRLTERLRAAAPAGAVLVRLSGDCFAVAVPARDGVAADEVASRLQAAERAPFLVTGRRVRLTLSIGCAMGQAGQTTTAQLLHEADLALVAAQRSRTGISHAQSSSAAPGASSVQLVDELHEALSAGGGGLQLWFQPQLHLHSPARTSPTGNLTTTLAGCEALLRWEHPTRGILGPGAVLATADHGRLLPQLTALVIDQALDHVAAWWPVAQLPVSINLSAQDLDDPRLPHQVLDALAQRSLPPWALTVEIVEDTVMLDPARARRVLGQMRQAGVHISIDDYGTGYSSLAYLHELPVDELKLDRSLTADIAHNAQSAAIIRHSVALAHDLGLLVVAEGVEDGPALAALQRLGCDVVQGFLLGRPMPAAAWSMWMLDHYGPRTRTLVGAQRHDSGSNRDPLSSPGPSNLQQAPR